MTRSSAPAAKAVMLQKDPRAAADADLAVIEFSLGATVAVALVLAAVLAGGRRTFRARWW